MSSTHTAVPKTKHEDRTKEPPLYKVLFHNDDFTPQDFVVELLVGVFGHTPESAFQLMMTAHRQGVCVAGIYPHEIAETKAQKATELALKQEHALLVTLEPEGGHGS